MSVGRVSCCPAGRPFLFSGDAVAPRCDVGYPSGTNCTNALALCHPRAESGAVAVKPAQMRRAAEVWPARPERAVRRLAGDVRRHPSTRIHPPEPRRATLRRATLRRATLRRADAAAAAASGHTTSALNTALRPLRPRDLTANVRDFRDHAIFERLDHGRRRRGIVRSGQ